MDDNAVESSAIVFIIYALEFVTVLFDNSQGFQISAQPNEIPLAVS